MTVSMVPSDRTFDPLAAAEGAVRDYCGWHVAPEVTEEWVLDGEGTFSLLVPSLQVKEVLSVQVGEQVLEPADVLFSPEAGIFALRGGQRWTRGLGNVRLQVTHGYAQAPPALLGVIEAARKRAAGYGGAVSSQRAGTQSVNYFAGSGLPLTPDEKSTLERYRLHWGL